MASNKTPNLNLPQYSGTDLFNLEEVNESYRKIDTAYSEIKTSKDSVQAMYEEFRPSENTRIENEKTRQENEGQRVLSEDIRVVNEKFRESAENRRVQSENKRESKESTRVMNETLRQGQEATRESRESSRNQSESSRNSNETLRQQNEYTRQMKESERLMAEEQRLSNESFRQSEEEYRASNEQARVSAESSRKTKFDEMELAYKSSAGEIVENRKGYDGTVYASMYEARIVDTAYLLDKINNAQYLEKTGTNITATNSYDGLTKDMVVKGRTLQNLLDKDTFYNASKWQGTDGQFSLVSEKGYVTLTANGGFVNGFILLNNMFKPSTKYTIVMDIKENSLSKEMVSGFVLCGSHSTEFTTETKNSSNCDFTPGTKKILITTKEDLSSSSYSLRSFIYGGTMTGKIVYRVTILEGDHTNTPIEDLPYGEGIYSAGENEVTEDGEYKISGKSCGKNLFDLNKLKDWVSDIDINNNSFVVSCWAGDITKDIQFVEKTLKTNTKYTISFSLKLIKKNTDAPLFRYQCGSLFYNQYTKKNFGGCFAKNLTTNGDTETLKCTFTTPNDLRNYRLLFYTNGYGSTSITENDSCLVTNMMIEESSEATSFEPYQESTYSYILDEPLRSLPNGVCDTIEGDKVIRRVGKVVLDGSGTITYEINGSANTETGLGISTSIVGKIGGAIISDRFVNSTVLNERIWIGVVSGRITLRILKEKLASPNLEGFKKWIQANPTTVYYELAQPIIEELDKTLQLKSFDGTTHIISDNYLTPITSAKIPSNVQAVVSSLITENKELTEEVSTLSVENEELKQTNEIQDELIDINMCATDEMYVLLEPLLAQSISTMSLEREVSKMVDLYVAMIQRGLKTIDEVPTRYREQVKEVLAQLEK